MDKLAKDRLNQTLPLYSRLQPQRSIFRVSFGLWMLTCKDPWVCFGKQTRNPFHTQLGLFSVRQLNIVYLCDPKYYDSLMTPLEEAIKLSFGNMPIVLAICTLMTHNTSTYERWIQNCDDFTSHFFITHILSVLYGHIYMFLSSQWVVSVHGNIMNNLSVYWNMSEIYTQLIHWYIHRSKTQTKTKY